jgi:hypothetical protein
VGLALGVKFALRIFLCTGFDSHPFSCLMHAEEFYFAFERSKHEVDPSALVRQAYNIGKCVILLP